jgi:hypothetical protein
VHDDDHEKTDSDLVASIEPGLDRMLTSPTERVRRMRLELEREENERQRTFEMNARERQETLTMARSYLQSLPR